VLAFVYAAGNGKGDVVYEAVDVMVALRALIGRWFPGVDLDAETAARLERFGDPNGGHQSCVSVEVLDS
jgi:hypothetical protein